MKWELGLCTRCCFFCFLSSSSGEAYCFREVVTTGKGHVYFNHHEIILFIFFCNCFLFFFLRFYLFICGQGKRGRKRKKHQCVVASHVPPIGDLAHNPGMCPDWGLNQHPLALSHTSQGDTCFFNLTFPFSKFHLI